MLGINTVILHQTLFPNKCLAYESMEQMGALSHWGGSGDPSKQQGLVEISNGFIHHHFYMADIPPNTVKKHFGVVFFNPL